MLQNCCWGEAEKDIEAHFSMPGQAQDKGTHGHIHARSLQKHNNEADGVWFKESKKEKVNLKREGSEN